MLTMAFTVCGRGKRHCVATGGANQARRVVSICHCKSTEKVLIRCVVLIYVEASRICCAKQSDSAQWLQLCTHTRSSNRRGSPDITIYGGT